MSKLVESLQDITFSTHLHLCTLSVVQECSLFVTAELLEPISGLAKGCLLLAPFIKNAMKLINIPKKITTNNNIQADNFILARCCETSDK